MLLSNAIYICIMKYFRNHVCLLKLLFCCKIYGFLLRALSLNIGKSSFCVAYKIHTLYITPVCTITLTAPKPLFHLPYHFVYRFYIFIIFVTPCCWTSSVLYLLTTNLSSVLSLLLLLFSSSKHGERARFGGPTDDWGSAEGRELTGDGV
jgi:hypothetical protein